MLIFCLEIVFVIIQMSTKISSPQHMSQGLQVDTDTAWGGKGVLKPSGKTRVPFSHFSQYLSEASNALRVWALAAVSSNCGQTSLQPGVKKSLWSSLTIAFKPWGKELTRCVSSAKFAKHSYSLFYQVLFLVNICFSWDWIIQASNLENIYIHTQKKSSWKSLI